MIEFARFESDGSITAGPIDGLDWIGITPGSRFWQLVERWVEAGNTISVPIINSSIAHRVAKTTPWLRMTEGEAIIMDDVMSQTSPRLKQIYMAAQYLSSDDDLWGVMHQLLTDHLPGGAGRAAELLAPDG